MGLFVTEDGYYQGWLAAFLCCLLAIDQDESPAEKQEAKSGDQLNACCRQQQPMQHSTSTLTLHAFKRGEPHSSGNRCTNQISDRPPSLNPLNFEEKPLISWSRQSTPNASPRHQRPSISSPYAFRRLDQTEPQRQGLIPLRLGPVVLRDSPRESPDLPLAPDSALSCANDRFNPTDNLLTDDGRPSSYREKRESPFQRCRERSWNATSSEDAAVQIESIPTTFDEMDTAITRPPLTLRTSSAFAPRQEPDTLLSSTKSKPSHERARLKRKHSLPVLRKDDRLEQEILELNTIVEERRAENAREKRTSQHVPAVAPSMQVRARSETLTSIGSALSRTLPTKHSQDHGRTPDAAMPQNSLVQRPISASSWSSSRFSGSVSDVWPSSPPAQLPNGELFYKCRMYEEPHRRASEGSICTYLTELDSPSLATSSPISHGHSRHLTDESRTTPLSPCTPRDGIHSRGLSKVDKETQWPFFTMTNTEVGVAF